MRDNYDLRRDAREHKKLNLTKILLASILFTLAVFVINILDTRLSGAAEWSRKYMNLIQDEAYVQELLSGSEAALAKLPELPQPTGFAYFMTVLLQMALIGLQVGYMGYFLRRARGNDAQIMDIFPGLRYVLRGILINLLVGMLVGIGFILFIVPGIMLLYRYRLAIYVMYDHPDYNAIDCMRESAALMSGNKMRLFRLDISFIGWIILSAVLSVLLFPVLDIWLTPYIQLSRANFYTDLVPDGDFGRPELYL